MKNQSKLFCTVAAAAVLIGLNGAAFAADLPVKARPLPPIVAAPDWSGFYVGGHVGYGWSKMTGEESGGDQFTGPLHLNGALVGVHGGYNWQVRQWVFGVEGDLSGAFGNSWGKEVCTTDDLNCRFSGSASMLHGQLSGLASIRGRLGWAFDRTLIYATGGLALGNYRGFVTSGSSINPISKTVAGGVVGAGIEWKYKPNLSLRLEGLHYMFNNTVTNVGSEASGEGFFKIHSADVIRVGASYHFNP